LLTPATAGLSLEVWAKHKVGKLVLGYLEGDKIYLPSFDVGTKYEEWMKKIQELIQYKDERERDINKTIC
jgi:hypothetical protein